MHARYAAHARTFFVGDFVSIENKGSKIQLPKLKVASSSLVACSSCPALRKNSFQTLEIPQRPPKHPPEFPRGSVSLQNYSDLNSKSRFYALLINAPV